MTYIVQIDHEIREATPSEAEQIATVQAEGAAQAAAADAKAAALASARIKLSALGLTDAEVAALLGG